jgi:hypothetical protein
MDENYIELLENYFIDNEECKIIINDDEPIDYKCRRRYCYFGLCFSFSILLGLAIYFLVVIVISS